MHFGTFLKGLDSTLYGQYVFERYGAGLNGPKAHKSLEDSLHFEEPKFDRGSELDKIATPLSKLPDDNEAVQYCLERKIPRNKFSELYFLPQVKDIVSIAPKYEKTLSSTAPRLALPFYTVDGRLSGLALRAIRGEALRYINVKVLEDEALLFGINSVDFDKTLYVVEGPIDSLFLENSIACAGTSFGKIESLDVEKKNMVVVFDNQPRNKEVCALIEKYIELGYSVCVWPCHMSYKDINDMVIAGVDATTVIGQNIYSGLMAKAKFAEWRNC